MDDSSAAATPGPLTRALGSLDAVTGALMAVLVLASIASWCVIVWRARQAVAARAAARATAEALAASPTLAALRQALAETPADARGAAYTLAAEALTSLPFHGTYDPGFLARLERRLRHGIEARLAAAEQGLGLLATTAAVAPFVGLLGTVWGIYHALTGLAGAGAAGGMSIDRVAGPVGEALVMTGVGLAVAIPAAVAYNVFARQARQLGHALDDTAHRLRDLAEPLDAVLEPEPEPVPAAPEISVGGSELPSAPSDPLPQTV